MNKSDSIELLSKALVKAQAEMPAVTMDAVNPFFKSHYATLGAIIEATRPVLAKYGLAVSQLPYTDTMDNSIAIVGVLTMLIHESGQYISQGMSVQVQDKNAAQAAGSAITYLRRYSLAAILGIYSDEDDDGNSSKPTAKPVKVESAMTMDDAADVKGKDGIRYGDCTTEDLKFKFNALQKAAKQSPNDAEVARKLEAARMLIASRK